MEDYESLDNKKTNKPLMEKRRRERINNCLDQLKTLILEATKKDASRYTKLEKADILEMSVRHLRALQRQQMAVAMARDSSVITRYRAGFNQCAEEVVRYLGKIDGVSSEVRNRLLGHLANCMQNVNNTATAAATAAAAVPHHTAAARPAPYPMQVHIPVATQISALPGATVNITPSPVMTSSQQPANQRSAIPSPANHSSAFTPTAQPITPRLSGAFHLLPGGVNVTHHPPIAFVLPQTPANHITSPSASDQSEATTVSPDRLSESVTSTRSSEVMTSPERSDLSSSSCELSLYEKDSPEVKVTQLPKVTDYRVTKVKPEGHDLNNNDDEDDAERDEEEQGSMWRPW